jgi:hypothetical protein
MGKSGTRMPTLRQFNGADLRAQVAYCSAAATRARFQSSISAAARHWGDPPLKALDNRAGQPLGGRA